MIISSKMAASIYATPPPDLSSEDTALSDVSNSSTLNTNRNNHTSSSSSNNPHEATGATTPTATSATSSGATGAGVGVGVGGTSPTAHLVKAMELQLEPQPAGSGTNEADHLVDAGQGRKEAEEGEEEEEVEEGQGDANMATMAAAMQLQLLEALSDAAKKRRKQHNPSRLEALNLSGESTGDVGQKRDTSTVDYEEKLSKMFLPKSIEQLKETFEMLKQQKQEEEQLQPEPEAETETETEAMPDISEPSKQRENPYHTYCKQCGESFETEFKLSLHMLQDHGDDRTGEQDPADFLASIKVKLERADIASPQLQEQQMQQDLSNGHGKDMEREQEHWFQAMQAQHHPHGHGPQMPPTFPFPPEAALGPAGYLPLLGMSGFPGVDGLNRPPLRIFNPEAYCELCNKEFCNKYFLKTHKANKHGIFDPVGESSTSNTSSHHNNNNNNITSSNNNNSGHPNPSMSSMSQMFQLQREANQVAKQEPIPGGAASTTPVASVHCDICSKRFTNIFAMRRHRAKQHDTQPAQDSPTSQTPLQSQSLRGSPNEASPPQIKQEMSQEAELPKPYQLPEGFREDFTLEQEELSFVPPPRKLPSHLHQQAKEANFSPDKLRRLGVQFPDFFCELCYREYANRYFLRTHKWKRHGLFVPPEDVTPQPGGKDEGQMPSAWPFMPLNLMLAKAAAATMDQQEQEREREAPEAEPDSEQPSKRIKLEQEASPSEGYDEDKLNGSVVGLQNLQKLQSMLQQLNDINGKRPLPCHLCGQEQENQYTLRAHLMTEHAGQMQLPMPMPIPLPDQQAPHPMVSLYHAQGNPQTPPAPGARSPPGGDLRCQQCDRDFATAQEFKQHIAEVHMGRNGGLSGSPLRDGFFTPERPVAPPAGGAGAPSIPAGNRPAYTLTPTSSYCEICNKELCNKYFMKTHMQRMHGIEIENGAQIGGVVCNICNKELCSKYFLRVHKHNTHGIIEEGSPLPQPRGQNGVKMEAAAAAAAAAAGSQPSQQDQDLNVSPTTVEGGAPSNSNHEVCPLCSRQFRSFKWLRSHLMNEHGTAGVERLREMDTTQSSGRSKPNSPTLKIPNGSSGNPTPAGAGAGTAAPNLAQALQNLNAQHLFGQMQQQQQMPKMPPLPLPGMFGEPASRFKEYQCSLCPFTTPYYAFLFIHERSHALLNNGGEAMELPMETPAPQPSRNPGKSRSKSSKAVAAPPPIKSEEPEPPLEPTNLSTSAPKVATHSHSPITGAGSPSPANYSPKATSSSSPKIQRRRSSSSKPPTTPNGLGSGNGNGNGGHRSAATSPFEGCGELANGSGKPASYAQPDRAEEAYQMQAFHLQPADADSEMQFAPALVYLPVRVRASESATLSFRLTPA
ncbi:uncharacterized protein LOC108049406 isoform X1 [Drosophila rhopaloa]|uniref:C2H2-type domain-containing protein n=2 Tax=Drosophila rhopaloa TaxID=1041015 RepID=A0ABM5HVQ0_DRORH|nr:uncharacterized protein LOC108049406 isoform X1 [Drosophila rhopaloa]